MVIDRSSRAPCALLFAGLCVAGCSHHGSGETQPPAAESTSYQTSGYTAPEDVRVVNVTVEDADASKHTVTFKAQVTPEANISRNGTPIRIDQLQKGDQLRIYIDTRTGEVVRAEVTQANQ